MLWSYYDDFARTIAPLSSRRPLSQRDCSFGHGQNNLNDCNHRSIPQAKAPVFARRCATAAGEACRRVGVLAYRRLGRLLFDTATMTRRSAGSAGSAGSAESAESAGSAPSDSRSRFASADTPTLRTPNADTPTRRHSDTPTRRYVSPSRRHASPAAVARRGQRLEPSLTLIQGCLRASQRKNTWKKTHIGLPMTCYMVCLSN